MVTKPWDERFASLARGDSLWDENVHRDDFCSEAPVEK
jgi:hypothetical protein